MRNLKQRVKKLEDALPRKTISDEELIRFFYLQLRWYVHDALKSNEYEELVQLSNETRDDLYQTRWFDPHNGKPDEFMLNYIKDLSVSFEHGDLVEELEKVWNLHP